MLRVRLCGAVAVEVDGHPLPDALLAGRQGRLVLAYLVCERHRAIARDELAHLLWPDDLPDSWTTSLSAVISRLRRLLTEAGLDGASALASGPGGSYQLVLPPDTEVDWEHALAAVTAAERDLAAGNGAAALAHAAEAAAIVGGGFHTDDCAWVDAKREAAFDVGVRAALATAEAHLLTGATARAIEAAREAVALDGFREAAYRVLMRALAAAGERGEALRVWERCRTTLVEELGVDPSAETEAVYVSILGRAAQPPAVAAPAALPSGVVTFLLTDIVESSAMWEQRPAEMAIALERHDALVAAVVAANGGTMLKSKLEGDATVSVFARASASAAAALALRQALQDEEWPEGAAPSLRMAIHTGEAFERDGDYFGPALNRAARLRALAGADQVLLSQAVAELVRDSLPADVALVDRGHRDLRGLSRGENVYELAPVGDAELLAPSAFAVPALPPPLTAAGPFVGREDELARLAAAWERAEAGQPHAILLAGEPGVGKSRLAAECARAVHDGGGIVVYGRCDEELGAPLQPFVEALRGLAPAMGAARLRAIRGVDELGRAVPEVGEMFTTPSAMSRVDPDSERYALFDAITELLCAASAEAPLLLVLDDLHWAGKSTLSLLRHLLRNAGSARLLLVGTYRDTELARSHPLAATIADLRRDRVAERITLSGLAPTEVTEYLRAVGNTDRALGQELAEVTSGNPFFLIEALRHVEETGGHWEPGSLPEGVREATGRRLSQLSDDANEALSVAAVAGTSFDLSLVEQVRGAELIDEMAEAVQAGLVLEEAGSPNRFRFAHALVRQVLLAELVTLKRVRLHRAIAELLEANPGNDPDAYLADLAYHWFECASTGSAERAVTACRQAADRASEKLAYEEAGDLYAMALQALDAVDRPDDDQRGALHLARCETLLTAGDVAAAREAIEAFARDARGSERLSAWHTTYAGQLTVLSEPDRLDDIVASIGDAAAAMQRLGDQQGEAKAHYVHALALERLGQIGAAEHALEAALEAARSVGDRRLADAILAEAPPAALWGPSTVTRASGRCLDVVRVLRITAGAPAVESVAMRCQAVLEALRGRTDAARRMIASATRTVDQLGLVHRRLEAEVSAGFIELLAADPVAAEGHLRPAFEELRDRGLGGEAALAAGLLGRALLQQRRDDEAEQTASEAEKLAGSDLKAAIIWRDVRAAVAARRGDTEFALDLAREAVELASGTDALLLVSDARLALATVLRVIGDAAAADAEFRRAAEAADAKGATVLAERARTRSTVGAAVRDDAVVERGFVVSTRATRAADALSDAWKRRDRDAVLALHADGYSLIDRRRGIQLELSNDEAVAGIAIAFDSGAEESTRLLATRGAFLSLCERTWTGTDPAFEVTSLVVDEVDTSERYVRSTFFDLDDLDAAYDELDELFAQHEAAEAPQQWNWSRSYMRALREGRFDDAEAMFAPGFVVVGHGRYLKGDRDATGLTNLHRELYGLRAGAAVRVRHVLAREANRALSVSAEATADADDFEIWSVAVSEVADDGRPVRTDIYGLRQLDDAWARYHEIGAPQRDPWDNAATQAVFRFADALTRQDWDAFEACFAPMFHVDDRRTLVGMQSYEADATRLRFVFEGSGELRQERIATRDDHLVLYRSTHWKGDAEVAFLAVARTNDAGRIDLMVSFGPDETDAAYDELDDLAGDRGSLGRERDVIAALSERDWDAVSDAHAADCVFEDHRLARLGVSRGRDARVSMLREFVELAPDARMRIEHSRNQGDTAIALVATVGNSAGAPFEVRVAHVLQVNAEGRLRLTEYYDEDQLGQAFARFHELCAPVSDPWDNAATRAAFRFADAVTTQDWAAVEACFPPAFRIDDRRSLVGSFSDDATAASLRFIFDGGGAIRQERVATRGDNLVLVRPTLTQGGAEVVLFVVLRTDAANRIDLTVWFDVGDEDAAYDELDALAAATPGPDVTALLRELADEAPDARPRVEHARSQADTAIAVVTTPVELRGVDVVQVDADGRLRLIENYDEGHLDEAFARFRELTSAASALDRFSNNATRCNDQLVERWNARDWDGVAACCAPDYGAEIENLRLIFDQARSLTIATLATRGTNVSLSRTSWKGADDGVLVDTLAVTEVDDNGRRSVSVSFDPDDIDAAYAELEGRYEAYGATPAEQAMVAVVAAMNRRDWDAFLARLAAGALVRDHRAVGFGSLTRTELVDFYRATTDLSPDTRSRLHEVLSSGSVAIARTSLDGTRDASSYVTEALIVFTVDEQGRARTGDYFDLNQATEAFARYDELVAAEQPSLASRFANLATHNMDAFRDAWHARDWDRVAACYRTDMVLDDRRSFVQLRSLDAEANLESLRIVFFGAAESTYSADLMATRGDRLALFRSAITRVEDGTAVDRYLLAEVDDAGLRAETVLFDLDDVDAAFDELDCRYVALGASDVGAGARLYNARDWAAFSDLFADPYTHVDRRRLGWGVLDRDGLVARLRGLVDLAPDSVQRILHARDRGRVGLRVVHNAGTMDGGEYELFLVSVEEVDAAGRRARGTVFDLEDLEQAFEHFNTVGPADHDSVILTHPSASSP